MEGRLDVMGIDAFCVDSRQLLAKLRQSVAQVRYSILQFG